MANETACIVADILDGLLLSTSLPQNLSAPSTATSLTAGRHIGASPAAAWHSCKAQQCCQQCTQELDARKMHCDRCDQVLRSAAAHAALKTQAVSSTLTAATRSALKQATHRCTTRSCASCWVAGSALHRPTPVLPPHSAACSHRTLALSAAPRSAALQHTGVRPVLNTCAAEPRSGAFAGHSSAQQDVHSLL